MRLSVIIPVYNETRTLRALVEKVLTVNIEKEIVIVDDGSTDDTPKILQSLAKDYPDITVLRHPRNAGKGAAVRTGIEHAKGAILIIQDADLEYDPNDYHACIGPIERGECQVVYGSRILNRKNNYSHLSFYIGGRLVTLAANLLYGARLTDTPTCYKTFEASLIKSIRIDGNRFDWEPEVTAKILRRGIQIKEVPIAYHPRPISEGKHIRWKDGVQALWTLIKYRFR